MKVKSESESEVAQSCPTLIDPMACSLPGSSIHGIFQARVLEWGAIVFSDIYLIVLLKEITYVKPIFQDLNLADTQQKLSLFFFLRSKLDQLLEM